MDADQMGPTASGDSSGPTRGWVVGCLSATVILLLIARTELQRLEQGTLFAMALPWDAPASPVELIDARMSAQDYTIPALLFLLLIGVVSAFAGPQRLSGSAQPTRLRYWLTGMFLVSVVADLLTTLWFFHDGGIDLEVHPGIRLFGYAYGRTIGPVAGKLVQAAGILWASRLNHRAGLILLLLVTLIYMAAAVYNLSQLQAF